MKADVRGRIGEVGKRAQGLNSLKGESSSLLMSRYTKIIIIHIFPKRKGVPSSGPRERRNNQVSPLRASSRGQGGQFNRSHLLLLGKFEYTGGPIFKVVLEC